MAKSQSRKAIISPQYWGWKKSKKKIKPRWRQAPLRPKSIPLPVGLEQPLSRLPADIRNQIYDLIFGHDRNEPITEDDRLAMGLLRSCRYLYYEAQPLVWSRPHLWYDSPTVLRPAPATHVRYRDEGPRELIIELRYLGQALRTNFYNPALFHRGGVRTPEKQASDSVELIWLAKCDGKPEDHDVLREEWPNFCDEHEDYNNNEDWTAPSPCDVEWMRRDWDWIFHEAAYLGTWPTKAKRDARGRFLPAQQPNSSCIRTIFENSYYQNIEQLTLRLVDYDLWEKRFQGYLDDDGKARNYQFFSDGPPRHSRDTMMLLAWLPDGDHPTIKIEGPGAHSIYHDLQFYKGMDERYGDKLRQEEFKDILSVNNDMLEHGAPLDWPRQILKKKFVFVEGDWSVKT